jgi:FlgD Ig-like domain
MTPPGIVDSEEQEYIINYLNSGGALYMESPDIGQSHFETDMFAMFGADFLADGGDYEVYDLIGQAGTITENLGYAYDALEDDCHFSIDCLEPLSGESLFQSDDEIDRVIASNFRGYRSIISSVIFGCFTNDDVNNTKDYLMEQYLSYLDVDYTAEGEVCGTILNGYTQEPIENVHVIIGEVDAYSDPNGFFSIILEEGVYSMLFEHADYYCETAENVVIIPIETTTVNVQMCSLVGVGNDLIAVTALNGNYPNPFNPETTISFSIKKDNEFTVLEVFNIKGQKVKTMVNEELASGQHSVVWNGIDDAGKSVSSGVYFYKMKAGTFQETKKMILMK